MAEITQIASFVQAHWLAIVGALALFVKGCQGIVALLLLAFPQSKALLEIKAVLDAAANNLPTPSMVAKLRPPPKAVAALLFCALLPLASCAAFEAVVQKTVACDAANVQSSIPSVLGDVVSALQSDQWNTALDTLALEQGVDIVACAIQAAITQIEAGSPSTLTTKRFRVAKWAAADNSAAISVSCANAWLAVHTK